MFWGLLLNSRAVRCNIFCKMISTSIPNPLYINCRWLKYPCNPHISCGMFQIRNTSRLRLVPFPFSLQNLFHSQCEKTCLHGNLRLKISGVNHKHLFLKSLIIHILCFQNHLKSSRKLFAAHFTYHRFLAVSPRSFLAGK